MQEAEVAARTPYDITEALPDDAVVLGFAGVVKYVSADEEVNLIRVAYDMTTWEALGALTFAAENTRAEMNGELEDDED